MSKKDRSLTNSRDEAKKIYYQRREINKLQQENQQLKEDYSKLLETSKAYKKLLKTTMQKEHNAIKVLDEIRDVLNNQMDYREFVDIVNKIEEILDKVKKL